MLLKKYEITCTFKSGQQLFRLKDKSNSMKMADIIYNVQYKGFASSYIMETTTIVGQA